VFAPVTVIGGNWQSTWRFVAAAAIAEAAAKLVEYEDP
jgi:hypothetical protein